MTLSRRCRSWTNSVDGHAQHHRRAWLVRSGTTRSGTTRYGTTRSGTVCTGTRIEHCVMQRMNAAMVERRGRADATDFHERKEGCVMTTATSTSAWTAERRARQREAIYRTRPWLRATGPTSAAGKARSSRNACRPDSIRQQLLQMKRELSQVLRMAKMVHAVRRRDGRYPRNSEDGRA